MKRVWIALGFWSIGAWAILALQPPLVGNFATKAACYAMIARNFALNPSDWLKPTLDVLVSGQKSIHLVEWPWPALGVGWFSTFGWERIDVLGRFMSWSLLPLFGFAVYRSAVTWGAASGKAADAAILFCLNPLLLIYFYSFQLDSWAVTAMACCVALALRAEGSGLSLSAVCWGFVLLIKPHWVLLTPMWIWLAASRQTNRPMLDSTAPFLISVIPMLLWTAWNFYYSSRSDAIYFSYAKSLRHNDALLSYWAQPEPLIRMLKNIGVYVIGPAASFSVIAGLVKMKNRIYRADTHLAMPSKAVGFALAANVLMLVLLPRKYYEANYYYLPLVVSVAPVWIYFFLRITDHSRRLRIFLWTLQALWAGTLFLKSALFVPVEERNVFEAASKLNGVLPRDARVVTVAGASPVFLYYLDRVGWTWSEPHCEPERCLEAVDEFMREGATHLVAADGDKFEKSAFYSKLIMEHPRVTRVGPATMIQLEGKS